MEHVFSRVVVVSVSVVIQTTQCITTYNKTIITQSTIWYDNVHMCDLIKVRYCNLLIFTTVQLIKCVNEVLFSKYYLLTFINRERDRERER